LKPLPKLLTKVVTLLFHGTVCSPDIRVYAYAAAQVKKAMEVIPHCTDSLGPLPLSSTTFWVFFSFESLPQQYCSNMFVHALQVTHELGGENYVFWGGREGYQTLLNTDLKKELDHMATFLQSAASWKKKLGFKGNLLLEPKPQEPTKHQ
jgi:xylose isomerase